MFTLVLSIYLHHKNKVMKHIDLVKRLESLKESNSKSKHITKHLYFDEMFNQLSQSQKDGLIGLTISRGEIIKIIDEEIEIKNKSRKVNVYNLKENDIDIILDYVINNNILD